jgi:hypothetical protein
MNEVDMFLKILEHLKNKEVTKQNFDKQALDMAKQNFDKQALDMAKQMLQLKKAFVEAGFTSQEAFELVKSLMEAALR